MATGILQLLFDHNTSPVTSTDVTALLYAPQPVAYSKSTNQRWTCSFTLIDSSLTGANRPVVGQTFRLLEDGTVLFSGFIDQIDETALPGTRVLLYACSCSSWASLLDRRVITKVYQTNRLASDVISDIMTTVLAGEGLTQLNVVVSGSLTSPLSLDPITVAQAFDTIRDMTNAQWWIDENKDLHFVAVNAGPVAGWSPITSDAEWDSGTMKITRTTADYRNVQYVSSSTLGQPPPNPTASTGNAAAASYVTLQDTFVTTSAFDFFVMTSQAIQLDPNNPVPPTVTVGGVNQTIKKYFTDAFGANAWYWTQNSIGVQQGQQIAPSPGTTVVITYQAFAGGGGTIAPASGGGINDATAVQNWVVQSSASQIAARSALEGTQGKWEQVTSVPGITDPTVANALASGLLLRSGAIPAVIQYETWRAGYVVGSKITITMSPDYHGINGTYTVQQIDAREVFAAQGPISSKTMVYTVTLSNQQNIGNYIKWMEGLIRTIGSGSAGSGGGSQSSSAPAQPGLQVIREIPSGTLNGSNVTFTLTFKPQPPWAVWLMLNGVLQHELGSIPDYSLSGLTITFTVAPKSTDELTCIYFIANAGLAPLHATPNVYSTGPYQSDGQVDTHWVLSQSPDPTWPGPAAYVVDTAQLAPQWVLAPSGTRWISLNHLGVTATGGTYIYKTFVTLPAASGSITGFIAADDGFTLKINGTTVLTVAATAWLVLHAFTISSGFVVGLNTITIEVTESPANNTGVLVQITSVTSP